MKIRTSFVSNSSSSSFVCLISGEAVEVHDGCFWDAGLSKCINGHIFQKQFLVPWTPEFPSKAEMLAQLESVTDSKRECMRFHEMKDVELKMVYTKKFGTAEGGYECNANECPICTMTRVTDADLVKYFIKQSKFKTREALVKSLRDEFGGVVGFQRYINAK